MHPLPPRPWSTHWRRPLRTAWLSGVCAAALAASVALPARAAGAVEVRLVDPQSYADIGWRLMDREQNLERLRQHFQGLATLLPEGQRLRIEVLDVDLAGEELPGPEPHTVRVLRGRADWPRMRLRWELSAPGLATRQAEEWLSDPAYLERMLPARAAGDALPYDLRMVDEWFRARFVPTEPRR